MSALLNIVSETIPSQRKITFRKHRTWNSRKCSAKRYKGECWNQATYSCKYRMCTWVQREDYGIFLSKRASAENYKCLWLPQSNVCYEGESVAGAVFMWQSCWEMGTPQTAGMETEKLNYNKKDHVCEIPQLFLMYKLYIQPHIQYAQLSVRICPVRCWGALNWFWRRMGAESVIQMHRLWLSAAEKNKSLPFISPPKVMYWKTDFTLQVQEDNTHNFTWIHIESKCFPLRQAGNQSGFLNDKAVLLLQHFALNLNPSFILHRYVVLLKIKKNSSFTANYWNELDHLNKRVYNSMIRLLGSHRNMCRVIVFLRVINPLFSTSYEVLFPIL